MNLNYIFSKSITYTEIFGHQLEKHFAAYYIFFIYIIYSNLKFSSHKGVFPKAFILQWLVSIVRIQKPIKVFQNSFQHLDFDGPL